MPTSPADSAAAPPLPSAAFRPEILAPAGNEEMMKAAVENGADAIYFGLQQFNARMRAKNFDVEDLPRLMSWLHERGVKGYVTLNTLIFTRELDETAELLRACSAAGVDAVLLQDLGVAALAARLVPALPIHASTQMTVTSAEGIAALEAAGLHIERVVAARELSRKELRKLRAEAEVDVEVFVHGALCVAYSGQCLTSEALGGRSANRGECAQACRLPYDLVVDGSRRDIGDVKYFLSPKDLAAYEDIPDLTDLGIVSLKIEGRYKSPEYVAATVRTYREAIDATLRGEHPHLEGAARERLEMTFSRGLTGGYLHAIDHQAVVEGRFPKKRGLFLGAVVRVERGGAVVALESPLRCGDGLVFDAGHPEADEEGGRVYELTVKGKRVPAVEPPLRRLPLGDDADTAAAPQHVEALVAFGRDRVRLDRVKPGQRVWKTSDQRLEAELQASYEGEAVRFRRPVRAEFVAETGRPAHLTLWDEGGLGATVEDTAPADQARQRPLTEQVLVDQLGRLGGTPFFLQHLHAHIVGTPMVPLSRLNEMRRQAVEELIRQRHLIGRGRPEHAGALRDMRSELAARALGDGLPSAPPPASDARLSVLCRTMEQVEAAVAHGGVETIYTDFEDVRRHADARRLVPRRAEGGPRFVPATLRIVKPGEAGFVRTLLRAEPDALLVRNLASWTILRQEAPGLELLGDYSLNISNELTALLHRQIGFALLTPSYDLNIDQLSDLLSAAPAGWFEATVHQYMPMFHMEHCVFCRFLSTGTDFTNCGRPCDTHSLALRDRFGFDHVVKADAGCRNTVFNATAQSASEYVGHLIELGVRRFRVDLLTEDAATTRRVLDAYAPVVCGTKPGKNLWRELGASSRLGVTRGSLDHK